jgi:hypothetical protein
MVTHVPWTVFSFAMEGVLLVLKGVSSFWKLYLIKNYDTNKEREKRRTLLRVVTTTRNFKKSREAFVSFPMCTTVVHRLVCIVCSPGSNLVSS